jgi:hypothetical protein
MTYNKDLTLFRPGCKDGFENYLLVKKYPRHPIETRYGASLKALR